MAHLKPEMEEAINRQLKQIKPEIERQTREAQRRAEEYSNGRCAMCNGNCVITSAKSKEN